jgi:hypothetical protein
MAFNRIRTGMNTLLSLIPGMDAVPFAFLLFVAKLQTMVDCGVWLK